MSKLNKVRLVVYLPQGFAIALKVVSAITGENSSEIAKRILADGIKSESSALLVTNKLIEYAVTKQLLPPALIDEIKRLESDRRNLPRSEEEEIEIDLEG